MSTPKKKAVKKKTEPEQEVEVEVAAAPEAELEVEAEVEPKPEPSSSFVLFRSRIPEPQEFELNGVRASRNPQHPGFCEWRVPTDKADVFEKHFHVKRGRILRVE